jgi:tripartite-type tricarboxylate transporter receptor subunit TctC
MPDSLLTRSSSRRVALHASLLVIASLAAMPLSALAQDFPHKPIRLVVPYPPGGATDVVARTLAPNLSRLLGQQVFVENRGGGVSIIGTDLVAKSPADGYTLLMSDQALMTNPGLQPKLPYDTLKDLRPIALIGPAPSVIVVHPSFPAKNIQELIAQAKAKPGVLQYASSGNGTATHIAGELLKQVAGIQMTHISYKGGGPALTDAIAGHVPILISSIGPAAPMLKAGKLRPIAVTGITRSPALPDVPALGEAGLGAASVVGYWGVLAPASTPQAVADKLTAAFNNAIQLPEIKQRLIDLGVEPTGGDAAAFAKILNTEVPKMTHVIRSANITVD